MQTFALDVVCLGSFFKSTAEASLQTVNEPFVVECDASDVAVSASLNQGR